MNDHDVTAVYKYIDENMELYLGWLMEAVRQPSVSMYTPAWARWPPSAPVFLKTSSD